MKLGVTTNSVHLLTLPKEDSIFETAYDKCLTVKNTCPTCGKKIKITPYHLGGGRVDCFRCRTSLRVIPFRAGYIISKYRYPAYTINNRYRGPVLLDYIITDTKHPSISGNNSVFDRQMSKDEVAA